MSPKTRLGDEERRLMHLVPAPAVRLMKRRVLSRPGVNSLMVLIFHTPGLLSSFQRHFATTTHGSTSSLSSRRCLQDIYFQGPTSVSFFFARARERERKGERKEKKWKRLRDGWILGPSLSSSARANKKRKALGRREKEKEKRSVNCRLKPRKKTHRL